MIERPERRRTNSPDELPDELPIRPEKRSSEALSGPDKRIGTHRPSGTPSFRTGGAGQTDAGRTPDEWEERLRATVAETLRKRAAKNAMRAELAERRAYGLAQRHAQKLRRIRGGDTTKEHPMKTTCRYLRRGTAGQCTAEAVDPDGEVLICQHHLANALELLKASGFTITPPSKETEK